MGREAVAIHQQAGTVHREDGTVLINGTKTLITNAVDSRYLLTMARNPDAEDPRKAISMYLVPADSPGITVSPILKMCWHTADSSEISSRKMMPPSA